MGESSISRRNFIRGSIAAGLGMAGITSLGSMAGCAPNQSSGNQAGVAATMLTQGGHTYAVHEADVVVVGGGMAGLNATRMARNTGASVIMVDKGPVGHSGNSGVLWGQTFVTSEYSGDDGAIGAGFLAVDCMGILDQDQARNVSLAHIEGQPRSAIEQAGNMFQRGDDGIVTGVDVEGNVSVTHNTLYKQTAQEIVRSGVPVFDQMMMLDILEDEEGGAAGVVAVSLADGSAHVFRGKKTILCTGGYHWAAGRSCGSPESTGEGHYALLKRGLKFKDMEFPQYDFCGIHPYGYRPDDEKDEIEIAVTFPVNGEINHRMCNKDKKHFTKYFFDDPNLQSIAAFQGALITAAKEIYQGNGTPSDGSNDGIYFDLADFDSEPNSQAYCSYKGFKEYTERNLGYEFPDYLEVVANEYSSCGVPMQDAETCESEISGLYTVFVALSAMSSMWNWGQSYLAGKDAASKAMEMDTLPAFSPDDVSAALERAYGFLEADSTDGIRSSAIQRKIQRAFYEGQRFLKDESAMKSMVEELERIRTEDLPKMVCEDKSLAFNRDWRIAMEVEGMLACSLGTVHAAMERKESRSPFFRTDYTKMDNENYLCYLWTSMDKDWNWTVEKADIVDSVMPRDAIKQALNDQDPKFDISVPNEYL